MSESVLFSLFGSSIHGAGITVAVAVNSPRAEGETVPFTVSVIR